MSGVGGRRRAGFTLIELLLVIIILAAIAGSAVAMLDTATGDSQVRFEDTNNRLLRLEAAVLGGEGAPSPSGYVADMGRLPTSIAELLVQGTQPAYTVETAGLGRGIGHGWRGPYLRAIPAPDGLRYPDGWGRSVGAADPNFGWLATVTSGSLHLQTCGSDRAPGATTPDPLAVDYPATPNFTPERHLVPLASRSINVRCVVRADRANVRVRCSVVFFDHTLPDPPIVIDAEDVTANLAATSNPNHLPTIMFPASEDSAVPIGRRLFRLQVLDSSGGTVLAEWTREADVLPRAPLPDLTFVEP